MIKIIQTYLFTFIVFLLFIFIIELLESKGTPDIKKITMNASFINYGLLLFVSFMYLVIFILYLVNLPNFNVIFKKRNMVVVV